MPNPIEASATKMPMGRRKMKNIIKATKMAETVAETAGETGTTRRRFACPQAPEGRHVPRRRDADGRWLLTVPYSDPRELVMDVLRHVAEVEVLATDELRHEVVQRLRQGLRTMGLDE